VLGHFRVSIGISETPFMLLCFILFSVQPAQLEARLYDDDEAVTLKTLPIG